MALAVVVLSASVVGLSHDARGLRVARRAPAARMRPIATSVEPRRDLVASAPPEVAGSPALHAAEADGGRALGSMECLFAPRRMPGSDAPFTPHVLCATLDVRLTDAALRAAVEHGARTQPLLRARLVGSGLPERRTRLGSVTVPGVVANVLPFLSPEDMVRVGEPDPLRFAPMSAEDVADISARVLSTEEVSIVTAAGPAPSPDAAEEAAALEAAWHRRFADELSGACGDLDAARGPLWRVTALRTSSQTALVICFNHAISDQASAARALDGMLEAAATAMGGRSGDGGEGKGRGEDAEDATGRAMTAEAPSVRADAYPASLEEAILGETRSVGFFGEDTGGAGVLGLEHGTARYVLAKATEGAAGELPPGLPPPWRRPNSPDLASAARVSAPVFRTIDASTVAALRQCARRAGVGLSAVLATCAAITAAELCRGGGGEAADLKVLLGLDMRRFGAPRPPDTLSCQAGSLDLLLRVGPTTAAALRKGASGPRAAAAAQQVYKLAGEAAAQVKRFVDGGRVRDSVLVFDWAMRSFEMTRLVELEADNPVTLGRAYGCGVSNAGEHPGRQRFPMGAGGPLAEEMSVNGLWFAVPHARTGALLPFSTVTLDGRMHVVLNAPDPLVTEAQRTAAADRFVDLLEALATPALAGAADSNSLATRASEALPFLTSGAVAVATAALALPHAGAWPEVVAAWHRVWAAGAMDADLAPLKFWTFFAAMHPVLQPALWISEVLHSGAWPGPTIGDLVPVSFAAANVAVLSALAASPRLRAAATTLTAAALIGFVSTGIDGAGELSAYNLALDDGIKGCPAYEEVRQPSMDGFDVRKYQGRWYELGFHDWTQFSEVYDTTLDIKLNADGDRWVDDFAVKGPAPLAAPKSWDKSPVANGAHYFLYGKVDRTRPGVLQESGFGLTFPNFIIDVQKDSRGEYTQALQFQCLERGGVRIFEGINFLSRTPENAEMQLDKMHDRATRAGLDPYGAKREEVHVVPHLEAGAGPVDNSWQRFWKALGVDKLLALAESAMHTQAEDILNKVQ